MNSSWDYSYWVRLVIVLFTVNISKLQPLVSEDNIFCLVYSDFCSNFLLCNVIDFLRMWTSIVESCLNRKFLDILSSFKARWSSLLSHDGATKSLLQIDEISFWNIWNIRQFKDKKLGTWNFVNYFFKVLPSCNLVSCSHFFNMCFPML